MNSIKDDQCYTRHYYYYYYYCYYIATAELLLSVIEWPCGIVIILISSRIIIAVVIVVGSITLRVIIKYGTVITYSFWHVLRTGVGFAVVIALLLL
mgnify:CR=1 FL=1